MDRKSGKVSRINLNPKGEPMNNNKTDSQQKTLEGHLIEMIEEQGPAFWKALVQVTGFAQNFGFCECGRMPGTLNVGRTNYMYCKECRTFWGVGDNLFSSWRYEDKSVWRENGKLLDQARRIEPKRLFVSSGQLALMTYEEMKEKEAKKKRFELELEGQEIGREGHTETNTERNARMITDFLRTLPNCPPELQL